MSRKHNAEKMLLRLFHIAEILAKAESDNFSDPKIANAKINSIEKTQTQRLRLKHTNK